MDGSIANHHSQADRLPGLALRATLVTIFTFAIAFILYEQTWLLAVVAGTIAGMGVVTLIRPVSHQHPEISEAYD